MLAPRGAEHDLARAQLALVGPDAHLRDALQHGVELVTPAVRVRLLLLLWLEAVDVAEETLRFEGPSQRQTRLVVEDIELDGKLISSGATVLLMLGAANRDAATA